MKNLFFALMLIPLFFASCGDDEVIEPVDLNGTLDLTLNNLGDLGSDYVYEGWLIVAGAPVSTGTFTVDADGILSQSSFEVADATLSAATTFVLSVEPAVDNDPAPSDVKYLAGDFADNSAAVTTSIVGDFSAASGKYIFKTPTTTTEDDDLSGVWFLDFSSGSPAVGLSLPTLPTGWAYEGWAVIGGTPVSTGIFTANEGADQSAAFSGTEAGSPPFPGEDFIQNAPAGLTFPTDLSGAPIVISIEPQPDNSAAPFALKPLFHVASATATAGTTYDMDNQAASTFPTGTVTRAGF